MAEGNPGESTIALDRSIPKGIEPNCDSCGDTKTQMMLHIMMEQNWITLCPICEGDLLGQLLRNYIKRKGKGKTTGFTGDISKTPDNPREEEVITLAPQEDGTYEACD